MDERLSNRKGFTLTEALVSCVILTGALITLSAVITRSMTNIRHNRQKEVAWQVLDRQLTTIDSMGIDLFVDEGITSGEIEESGATFNWEIEIYQEDIDNLYQVDIRVTWLELSKFHQIAASARFNGMSIEVPLVKAE